VAKEPAELPEPARYVVLPEVEAAGTVRNGLATSIFPMVYHDLARRIQLPFTRFRAGRRVADKPGK
jgi:hypothetical protein